MADLGLPPERLDGGREGREEGPSARYALLVVRIRGFLWARFDPQLCPHELDDITHDAAQTTALRSGDLRDQCEVLRYAQGMARNLALSRLKRQRRRPVALSVDSIVREFGDPHWERQVAQRDAREDVHELMAAVDKSSRELILEWLNCLREQPEASHRELAERLGWSIAKFERRLKTLRLFCASRGREGSRYGENSCRKSDGLKPSGGFVEKRRAVLPLISLRQISGFF